MAPVIRRLSLLIVVLIGLYVVIGNVSDLVGWTSKVREHLPTGDLYRNVGKQDPAAKAFRWADVPLKYPVEDIQSLPEGPAASIPKIQFDFASRKESYGERKEREKRLAAVKKAFQHSWNGYRKNAWLADEVRPLTGTRANKFGGWGATLVDTLDTLWVMGMEKDFAVAVAALKQIDFSECTLNELNVFETTIRHLGGLLGAYDLAGNKYDGILEKAEELGEMLYKAYDTPNHMPALRLKWSVAANGGSLDAPNPALVAELGSLTLEMTRLSQLTGNPKYHDATQRIMNRFAAEQDQTKLPGMWPISVNAQAKANMTTNDKTFTLGGIYLIHGGRLDMYKSMYLKALTTIKNNLVFEPFLPHPPSTDPLSTPLTLGTINVRSDAHKSLSPEGQHLTCFAGGMVAIGAKMFAGGRPDAETAEDMRLAARLTEGCVWAYRNSPTGIGPELYWHEPCRTGRGAVNGGGAGASGGGSPSRNLDDGISVNTAIAGGISSCRWDRTEWLAAVRRANPHEQLLKDGTGEEQWERFLREKTLPEGFIAITDPRYMLRPEAIESVFVLYRVTGDKRWQDVAWQMFEAITRRTRTRIAYAGVADVRRATVDGGNGKAEQAGELMDSMESFWTAETLKYFYLVFSKPEVVSLDEYVFNTEAHPLRWRRRR